MTNAERILTELDRRLDHPVRLVLYVRSAIALGFDNPPERTAVTLDVDVIIPLSDVDLFRNDMGFWDAQEGTNETLKKEGLYITHLFEANMVFLRKNWEQELIPITYPLTRWLQLFRPATLDLILTKMMRGKDDEDLADIEFMVRHDKITLVQLEAAFEEVVIPEMIELRDAFKRAQPCVRKIVQDAELNRF